MDRLTITDYLNSDAVKYSIQESKRCFLYESNKWSSLNFIHVFTVYFSLQDHIFKIIVVGHLPP